MHYFRLIRPINLLIIILTMYGVRFFIQSSNYFQKIDDNWLDFFLLVASTVMIAAGGNIINDYFDVKADRINKPEKLIITKHVERRSAILTHWILNGLAFVIAIYLSFKYESLWFVFVHLLAINVLWFYSMLFKRKILIGNLMIASLTAAIPLLVVIYFKVGNVSEAEFSEFSSTTWNAVIDFTFIYWLSGIAFIQNFAREIIKDAQDLVGDKEINVRSIPMKLGVKKSLILTSIFLSLFPICIIWVSADNFDYLISNSKAILMGLPILAAALINLVIILMIYMKKDQPLKLYDHLIKLTMVIGISNVFYLPYFYI